jgi:hypothetical protein
MNYVKDKRTLIEMAGHNDGMSPTYGNQVFQPSRVDNI